MGNIAKHILIFLDLSDIGFKRLRMLPPERKRRWNHRVSLYQTQSPEVIGLKPLADTRQISFPKIDIGTQRFEPEICGPTELSLSESANIRHVTIRTSSLVNSLPNHDDDDPPRGPGAVHGLPEFANIDGVIFVSVTLAIRRSITGSIELEVVCMTDNFTVAHFYSPAIYEEALLLPTTTFSIALVGRVRTLEAVFDSSEISELLVVAPYIEDVGYVSRNALDTVFRESLTVADFADVVSLEHWLYASKYNKVGNLMDCGSDRELARKHRTCGGVCGSSDFKVVAPKFYDGGVKYTDAIICCGSDIRIVNGSRDTNAGPIDAASHVFACMGIGVSGKADIVLPTIVCGNVCKTSSYAGGDDKIIERYRPGQLSHGVEIREVNDVLGDEVAGDDTAEVIGHMDFLDTVHDLSLFAARDHWIDSCGHLRHLM